MGPVTQDDLARLVNWIWNIVVPRITNNSKQQMIWVYVGLGLLILNAFAGWVVFSKAKRMVER